MKRFVVLVAVAFALLGSAPALAQYNPTTSQISPNSTERNSGSNSGANTGTNSGSASGNNSGASASGSASGSSGSSSGSLPDTGSNVFPFVAVGAGLVVLGGLIVLATRRRTNPAPA